MRKVSVQIFLLSCVLIAGLAGCSGKSKPTGSKKKAVTKKTVSSKKPSTLSEKKSTLPKKKLKLANVKTKPVEKKSPSKKKLPVEQPADPSLTTNQLINDLKVDQAPALDAKLAPSLSGELPVAEKIGPEKKPASIEITEEKADKNAPKQDKDNRLAAPDKQSISQTKQLAKDIFKEEYTNATTAAKKNALAKKLLKDGIDTKEDPTGRYVLFLLARDLATETGDGETAFEAINQMAKSYKIDVLAMKTEVLVKYKASSKQANESIAKEALKLVELAIAQDKYDLASKLVETAASAARKAKDYKLAKQVVDRKKEIGELAEKYEFVKMALTRLKREPTNAKANQAVGEYRSYIKGDWTQGLPMLALGNDETLKPLAIADLKSPSSSSEQIKLGDAWWNLAKKSKGITKTHIQWRAAHWYQKALPGLTGLSKTVTQKRLATIGEIPSAGSIGIKSSGSLPLTLKRGLILHYSFDKDEGTKVTDKSRTKAHGKISGPTWTSKGKSGGGIQFKGGKDIITTALRVDQSKATKGLTYLAWVYPSSASSGRHIVASPDNGGYDWTLLREGSKWSVFQGSGRHYSIFRVDVNQWQHVAVVFKPGSPVMLYKNAKASQLPTPRTGGSSGTLAIGENPSHSFNEAFEGTIDDVMVFSRPLSGAEVKKIYALHK